MKVLHVPFTWWPEPVGGTEIYVARLCRDLAAAGIQNVVCAPGKSPLNAEIDGIRVRRFVHGTSGEHLSALYGGDAVAADAFDRLLAEEAPDVVHQHALSPACSAALSERAKDRKIPVVFTYHTPTASCLRGTLLKWGSEVCSGALDATACTACALDGHGVARSVGGWLSVVPTAIGRTVGGMHLAGGVWTGLRMSALTTDYQAQVRRLLTTVDRIVVLTPWVEDVLKTNGVPASRIVRSRHGVPPRGPSTPRKASPEAPLRLVHLGRLDPTKGTHLLLDAIAQIPDAVLQLDVIGIVQSSADAISRGAIDAAAARDPRIRLLPPLPHDRVIDALAAYDAVVVPSQWMETGPLVVLEAFAAGVPVIGSALGGVADKIRDGIDGVLVRPFNNAGVWAATLAEAASRPHRLREMAAQVMPPRDSVEVARDMASLYDLVAPMARTAVAR